LDPALVGARTLGDPFYPTLGNGGYDTETVDLTVAWVAPDATHPAGHAVVTTVLDLDTTQDLAVLTLDLVTRTARVTGVTVDGTAASFRQDPEDRKLTITLPVTAEAGTPLQVAVVAEVRPGPVPRIGEGIPFRQPGLSAAESRIRLGRGLIADGEGGVLLAAQPNGAHTLFPVNDHPLDKATYRITLTAPPGMTGIATGTLASSRVDADGGLTTTWVSDDPVASHVISLAIGDRVLRSGPVVDGVTYRSGIPTVIDPLADEVLDVLPDLVGWLEDEIGRPYPFDAFGLVAYEGRPTAAILEGQTLVLMPSSVFSPLSDRCAVLGLLVHEAAHQWFGNDLAIARWDEKWLSEGHATWYEWRWLAEHGCLDEEVTSAEPVDGSSPQTGSPDPSTSPEPSPSIAPEQAFEARMRRAYQEAGLVRSVNGPPAAPRTPSDAYTPAIYDQGALALEALRQEIGPKAFGRFQRALLRRGSGGALTTDQLIDVASRVAKRDLRPFLEAWLRGDVVPPMPGRPGWTTDVPVAPPSAEPSGEPPAEPSNEPVASPPA
jgi:aminopeptidase N